MEGALDAGGMSMLVRVLSWGVIVEDLVYSWDHGFDFILVRYWFA
jgi:hypothetical protein